MMGNKQGFKKRKSHKLAKSGTPQEKAAQIP